VNGNYEKAGAVVIADGDRQSRKRVAGALQGAGYETIEVESGADALAASRAEGVGLVMLDVVLPDMTGYQVCRELRSAGYEDLPIFFLSGTHTETHDRVAGLLLGADDFIVRPVDRSELIARVQRFVDRRRPEPPRRRATDRPESWPHITDREREILELLAEGRSPKEVAGALSISPKTVATHVQNLLVKMGVHSRAALVARVYVLGLLGSS
jgi:DNA-binding NarL/FixJ family response regulator